MYALVSSDDLGRRIVLPIRKIRTVIGREADCDIVLTDENVSRNHAKVYMVEGRIEIKDLDSRNGTFVNGKRLDGLKRLSPGDDIVIGSNQFRIEEASEPESAPEMTDFRTVDQMRDALRDFDVRPGDKAVPAAANAVPTHTIVASRSELCPISTEKSWRWRGTRRWK
ncbi:MAG: FHA domain-containing protein [Deltaproteobacteria bacterium]|nr:FHA domain-containing protein [Deltaproteobacteria bacterium]